MRITKYHLSILGALLFGIFLTLELNAQEYNQGEMRTSPEYRYERAPVAERQQLHRKNHLRKNRKAHQTCAVAPRAVQNKRSIQRRPGAKRNHTAIQQRKIERAFENGMINKRQYRKSMKRLHKQHPHHVKKHRKLKKMQH